MAHASVKVHEVVFCESNHTASANIDEDSPASTDELFDFYCDIERAVYDRILLHADAGNGFTTSADMKLFFDWQRQRLKG